MHFGKANHHSPHHVSLCFPTVMGNSEVSQLPVVGAFDISTPRSGVTYDNVAMESAECVKEGSHGIECFDIPTYDVVRYPIQQFKIGFEFSML